MPLIFQFTFSFLYSNSTGVADPKTSDPEPAGCSWALSKIKTRSPHRNVTTKSRYFNEVLRLAVCNTRLSFTWLTKHYASNRVMVRKTAVCVSLCVPHLMLGSDVGAEAWWCQAPSIATYPTAFRSCLLLYPLGSLFNKEQDYRSVGTCG